jgi:hypothetical protein
MNPKKPIKDHPEFDFDDPRDIKKTTIYQRWERFHEKNPEVYETLKTLAYKATVRRGRKKIGIGMLFEVLRWEYYLKPDTTEEFKLCNDYRAPYARWLMIHEPPLRDIFNLRRSEVDEILKYESNNQ